MSTYYLHDGRNEIGPFTIDVLKKQKLTRNTPVRQRDSNRWLPAEKLNGLKDTVAQRKIRRPKDIVPVMVQRVTDLHYRKPRVLYGCLLCIALIAGISIYSIKKAPKQPQVQENVTATKVQPVLPVLNAQAVINTQVRAAGVTPKKKEAPAQKKEDVAKATRLRWNKLIGASNSNYGIGLLGGIKNLSVTVNNQSNYLVDEAVVSVTYIKANGGIWKTKFITINDVPAHESKEQLVPDVGRGKKVKVSLLKVVSKKMKFSYTEGHQIKNPDDPYFKE